MAKEMEIKFSGWHKVTLDGNLLTGDTYPVSNWIKKYLAGRWDSTLRGWVVDLKLVEKYTTGGGTTLMVR
jgi:hypothetical protein